MRYKCLVFDHDDTVVNSTATIHQPCFQEYLDKFHPGMQCSLEHYFTRNFSPGFVEMCRQEYGLDAQELHEEELFWLEYVKGHIPEAYPGIRGIMQRQKAQGGLICVVSHSFAHNIRRDYAANSLPEPDAVFGWEYPPEQRKPNPYPLERIMEDHSLEPSEILMIDDLRPGYDMAKSCGVDFAAVGWANDIEHIEHFMRSNCRYYFKTVAELDEFLR